MSNEETSDEFEEELADLRKLKENLLRKVNDLKKKLKKSEKTEGVTYGRTKSNLLTSKNEFEDLLIPNGQVNSRNKKCIALSSFMLGTKFSGVDKKWISDHKYVYTAIVKSKVLEFLLKLTVNSKDPNKDFEILDITCHFVDIRRCYILEITPWIERFSSDKDTVSLFSAVSDYTELDVMRRKILGKFKSYKIAVVGEYTEDDGGIMISLHSKDDSSFVYFEIRWVLKFMESMWRIDNFFVVQPVSVGNTFLKENDQLLQSFCKCGISKTDLESLWDKLCTAIVQDAPSDTTETSTQ